MRRWRGIVAECRRFTTVVNARPGTGNWALTRGNTSRPQQDSNLRHKV